MNELALSAVVLSIDVGLDGAAGSQRQSIEASARKLARLLCETRWAATWAISDEFDPAVILSAPRRGTDELALVAHGEWAGPRAPRQLFADALSRRLLRCRSLGFAPSTLVVRGDSPLYLDLLIKQGITAVRNAPRRAAGLLGLLPRLPRRCWLANTRMLRWGLWQLPTAVELCRLGLRRTARAFDEAAAAGGLLHLSIDVGRLASSCNGLTHVERILEQAACRRAEGRLRDSSVASYVCGLAGARRAISSRSILRQAA